MGWFKNLFGGSRPASSVSSTPNNEIEIDSYGGRVVSVPELDMMGQLSTSPNGKYKLLWRDRGWNGNEADPFGRYVLLNDGKIVVDARMDRPQDGKVADDGTFILNDWGQRNDLAGTFHAFSADGREILCRSYSANLLNNGLSENGQLAVCQTCNAPNSPDSSILSVFELGAGKIIAEWTAESGWADNYEFADGDKVRMLRKGKLPLHYSLTGNFLSRDIWLKDEVSGGNLYVIRKALAEVNDSSAVTVQILRDGIQTAISKADNRSLADALRLLGEIEEAAGNPKTALEAYDKALSENPKIGVARKAAALRKSLAN